MEKIALSPVMFSLATSPVSCLCGITYYINKWKNSMLILIYLEHTEVEIPVGKGNIFFETWKSAMRLMCIG